MIYAYIRVLTKQQNIDRQYLEIKEFGVDDKYINHKITNTDATKLIGVSRCTFFRLVKERKS